MLFHSESVNDTYSYLHTFVSYVLLKDIKRLFKRLIRSKGFVRSLLRCSCKRESCFLLLLVVKTTP